MTTPNLPLLTDDQIQTNVNRTVEFLHDLTNAGHTGFSPMLKVIGLNKDLTTSEITIGLPDMPETFNGRAEMMFQLGVSILKQGYIPLAAIFHSEAWMSILDKDENITCMPSEDPNKIEVVLVNCVTLDRKTCSSTLEIRRAEENITLVPYGPQADIIDCLDGNSLQIESNLLANFYYGVFNSLAEYLVNKFMPPIPPAHDFNLN